MRPDGGCYIGTRWLVRRGHDADDWDVIDRRGWHVLATYHDRETAIARATAEAAKGRKQKERP